MLAEIGAISTDSMRIRTSSRWLRPATKHMAGARTATERHCYTRMRTSKDRYMYTNADIHGCGCPPERLSSGKGARGIASNGVATTSRLSGCSQKRSAPTARRNGSKPRQTRRRRGDNFGADVFPFYSKGTCNVKVLPTLSRKTLSGDDLTEAQRDHDFNGKPRNPTQKSGR